MAAIFMLSAMIAAPPSSAQQATTQSVLREASITQNLNAQVPPDLIFRDEEGKPVRLGDYFGQKPIVLSLVYFNCPALCTEVLNGELHTMQATSLNLGKDYEAITVSFEPKDSPALAKAKRDVYTGEYGRTGALGHWHFLTGEQSSINALTKAVGFHYAYDPGSHQFAHPAAIMLLTGDGRIDRYFYGVVYPARDFRFGLIQASQGKIGSLTDHALMYCFQYDPTSGKYGLVVMNVVRVACGFTVLWLGTYMLLMFRRDRKNKAVLPAVDAKLR
jgi:protein SCO1